MKIFCIECNKEVEPRLTDGEEIYPHRMDLQDIPFWRCDACGNHVGCHHKTKQRTRPLGCIATPEILLLRKKIHHFIDPIWQSGKMPRGKLYAILGDTLGRQYHTADIRSVEEAERVLERAMEIYDINF